MQMMLLRISNIGIAKIVVACRAICTRDPGRPNEHAYPLTRLRCGNRISDNRGGPRDRLPGWGLGRTLANTDKVGSADYRERQGGDGATHHPHGLRQGGTCGSPQSTARPYCRRDHYGMPLLQAYRLLALPNMWRVPAHYTCHMLL